MLSLEPKANKYIYTSYLTTIYVIEIFIALYKTDFFLLFANTHKKPHNHRLTNKTKTIIDIVILPFSSRCSEDLKLPGDEAAGKTRACYNVEFTFDADTQVAITIYYQAIEEFHNGVPV